MLEKLICAEISALKKLASSSLISPWFAYTLIVIYNPVFKIQSESDLKKKNSVLYSNENPYMSIKIYLDMNYPKKRPKSLFHFCFLWCMWADKK